MRGHGSRKLSSLMNAHCCTSLRFAPPTKLAMRVRSRWDRCRQCFLAPRIRDPIHVLSVPERRCEGGCWWSGHHEVKTPQRK